MTSVAMYLKKSHHVESMLRYMDIFSQYSSNRSQIDLEKNRIYFQIVTTPVMYPT